jgi:ElaB/YqjD/DUF883 family membrane-anchored ribosome-binding protein
MSEMNRKSEKTLEDVQKQMLENMAQMQKDIAAQAKILRMRLDEDLDKGRGKVREKPFTYMGIALGIGLIAGAALVLYLKKDRD